MSQHISAQTIASDRLPSSQKPKSTTNTAIVTRSFTGRFRNRRMFIGWILAMIFFGTSWLSWGGRQAVLWNLDERKFYVFGATFWPQDFGLLSAILIISAFGLLAANVFVGRVWCGYTCPQSVWTWAFMWVEKVTEGDRNQRIKLAAGRWSVNKISRRIAKHGLWLAMSMATGLAFIGYFVPVRELSAAIISGEWFSASAFWVFMFASATYINAGWLREQVCLHMCPYSRFQSVMFDQDTLVVAYNADRGENRGSRKKDDDYKKLNLGDCVDCYMCVQVCPTGIDIRNGLQMDCIGCAACIDACDSVMDKMAYPRGLIAYTSQAQQSGQHRKFLRPLVLAYGLAVLLVAGGIWMIVYERELVGMSVIKDRTLYRKNSQSQIVNVYRLKIMNKTQQAQTYNIHLQPTNVLALQHPVQINLKAGEILDVPVSVVMNGVGDGTGLIRFSFVVNDLNDKAISVEEKTSFVYPVH